MEGGDLANGFFVLPIERIGGGKGQKNLAASLADEGTQASQAHRSTKSDPFQLSAV